jgi:hypothetical protein
MKDFELFVEAGSVKRRAKDAKLAQSLLKEAEENIALMQSLERGKYWKIIFETVYDALRQILDAILFLDGYKSYSHEASIAYLRVCGIEDSIIIQLDQFRKWRNGAKYYARKITPVQTEMIFAFWEKNHRRLIQLVESKRGLT